MRLKQVVYLHLLTLLLFLVNILISAVTGYSLRNGIMLTICTGYYLTLLSGFIYIKSINRFLKEKLGWTIQYVLSLSGIFLVEMLVATISGLYIFVVLVFGMNVPVKAKGQGYEIRLQPSFGWPPRYMLYKSNFLMQQHIGAIHANEEDFKIEGSIKNVVLDSDSVKVIIGGQKDTSIVFYP